jgi:hypothetical protein
MPTTRDEKELLELQAAELGRFMDQHEKDLAWMKRRHEIQLQHIRDELPPTDWGAKADRPQSGSRSTHWGSLGPKLMP